MLNRFTLLTWQRHKDCKHLPKFKVFATVPDIYLCFMFHHNIVFACYTFRPFGSVDPNVKPVLPVVMVAALVAVAVEDDRKREDKFVGMVLSPQYRYSLIMPQQTLEKHLPSF